MSEFSPRGNPAITFGEACDQGLVRTENQDSVLNASIHLGELFVVADGIGGYQGGATASRMVVEGFFSQLKQRPPGYPPEDALIEACNYTNSSIFNEANSGNSAFQRMGSTVVLALIQSGANPAGKSGEVGSFGPMAWIGHVGDSRVYLIRDGVMTRKTSDHSAVQALLTRNLISEEEARNHPDASVLTRSLGHRPQVEIEIDRIPLQEGDALLLCSDGLWGYVADADIAGVACDPNLSAPRIAELLKDLALKAGGHDNIGIEFIRLGTPSIAAMVPPAVSSASQRPTIADPRRAQPALVQNPAAAPEPEHGRRRTLEILAIALLLLGACGYLGIAAYSHLPPFSSKTPKTATDPRQDGTIIVNRPDLPTGASATPTQARPSDTHASRPADPVKTGPRKIAVAGEIQVFNHILPEPGEIEWQYNSIQPDNQPACLALAGDIPQVYADKDRVNGKKGSEIVAGIVKQYPDLKGPLNKPKIEHHDMNERVRKACGAQFDVVVVLPDKKNIAPPPTAAEAPPGPASTGSQDHSVHVPDHPRQRQ